MTRSRRIETMPFARCTAALLLAVCSLAPASLKAQTASPAPTARPVFAWVQEAAQGELHDLQFAGEYLRYRSRIVDSKGDQTRDVIESRDGTVARLIFRDGRALTEEENTAERQRLQDLLASPEAFNRHIHNDQAGKRNVADLLKLMPDAMTFQYAAGQPQRSSRPAGAAPEVVVDFEPKPGWKPPTLLSEALQGIHGRFWVDVQSHHVTRLEGSVFQTISIGFGLFAKVYPGGSITLEQVQARDHRWIYSHFTQNVTVRALMVKTIHQDADVRSGNFASIPGIPYTTAIRMLLETPLPAR